MITFVRALLLGIITFFSVLIFWDFLNPSLNGVKTNPYRPSRLEFIQGKFIPNTYFFFPKNSSTSIEANTLTRNGYNQSQKQTLDLNHSLKAFIHSNNTSLSPVIITESGSSPATRTIAKIPSPIKGISYELNTAIPFYDSGNIYLSWKLKNETDQKIFLSSEIKKQLNPSKILVTDFTNNRSFPIKYKGQIPIANCLLSEFIPVYGRIDCEALVGPVFKDIPGLQDDRILVKLPGTKEVIPVFVSI